MPNPKENNPLPTPENPNEDFFIEIRNPDKIYDFIISEQPQNKTFDSYNLGKTDINDNLIQDANIEVIKKNINNNDHEYNLVFNIKRQVGVGNSHMLDRNKSYLNIEKVGKIIDQIKPLKESSIYSIDLNGKQIIKIKTNELVYIITCGFCSFEKNNKAYYSTNPFIQRFNFDSEMNIYMIKNEYIDPEGPKNHFLPLKTKEDFIKKLNDFSKICELFIKSFYNSNNEKIPKKTLLLNCQIKNFNSNESSNKKYLEQNQNIINDFYNLGKNKEILENLITKTKNENSHLYDLFSSDLDINNIAIVTDGLSEKDLFKIINLTLASKKLLESQGVNWVPITNKDIIKTIKDFGF